MGILILQVFKVELLLKNVSSAIRMDMLLKTQVSY